MKILVLFLALVCVWWFKDPLIAEMIKEHHLVDQKSKVMTISYYNPYFPYFADIVTGREGPKKEWMQGYYLGRPYIFHDYYQKAVDLFPEIDSSHFLLGFCEYYGGNIDVARAQFEKTIELNPYFFWSYYNLGVIYFHQGEFYKSAMILNKALSLRKEYTLEILRQSPFYRQIWRYLANPPQTLGSNLSEGQEDAALLLAGCFIKAQGRPQAIQIIQSVGQGSPWHQELWTLLRKMAAGRQGTAGEADRLIQEQIPVRLF